MSEMTFSKLVETCGPARFADNSPPAETEAAIHDGRYLTLHHPDPINWRNSPQALYGRVCRTSLAAVTHPTVEGIIFKRALPEGVAAVTEIERRLVVRVYGVGPSASFHRAITADRINLAVEAAQTLPVDERMMVTAFLDRHATAEGINEIRGWIEEGGSIRQYRPPSLEAARNGPGGLAVYRETPPEPTTPLLVQVEGDMDGPAVSFEEFAEANQDALSPAELRQLRLALLAGYRGEYGGGAAALITVSRVYPGRDGVEGNAVPLPSANSAGASLARAH